MSRKPRARAEFGDFQTPLALAREVCLKVQQLLGSPRAVLEPACGRGSFVQASLDVFAGCRQVVGLDIDSGHIKAARRALGGHPRRDRVELRRADFFGVDWQHELSRLATPLLVLGNPPWVTSATLGSLESTNLPPRSRMPGLTGLDALTGQSNFDISEWLLGRLLSSLGKRRAMLAMLVKSAVARRVLCQAWSSGLPLGRAFIHTIDARRHFGAAVDACLFCCETGARRPGQRCAVHEGLQSDRPRAVLGFVDGEIVSDLKAFERTRQLRADRPQGWRSGVKHDCARVFELREGAHGLQNGFGEPVRVEADRVYPLLKGSDVRHGRLLSGRHLLLTQRLMAEDTTALSRSAPRTWAYLQRHAERLDGRRSRIYQNRPRFAIFGVGDYTFSPHKVAVSGLYGVPRFLAVPPREGRPVVFDDTVYFLPCRTAREARARADLLNGPLAATFFQAYLFPDAKRPITRRLLDRLDLALLRECD